MTRKKNSIQAKLVPEFDIVEGLITIHDRGLGAQGAVRVPPACLVFEQAESGSSIAQARRTTRRMLNMTCLCSPNLHSGHGCRY